MDSEFRAADTEVDWAECTVDGKILAFPYIKLMTMIFYNKEIFKQVGVSAPIPTWDDFEVAAQKIKALGKYAFAGMSGDSNAWTTMLMYSCYVGSAGGAGILRGLNDFSHPAWLEGAYMLQKLGKYVQPDAIGAAYPVAANAYLSGQAAMIANGPWMIAQIKDQGMYDKTGYMPYPGVKGKGLIAQAGPVGKMSTFYKNETDPDKMKLIVSFMKYHNSKENTKRMVLASAGAYATTATFTAADPMEPMLKDLYNWMSEVPWTIPYFSDGVNPNWDPAFTTELGLLWTGKTTPEQFVKKMEGKVFPK